MEVDAAIQDERAVNFISTQVIVDIIGGKLKEDKAGKNSNPDVNVTLRAFDPPLRYPLNESDLLCTVFTPYTRLTG